MYVAVKDQTNKSTTFNSITLEVALYRRFVWNAKEKKFEMQLYD